MNFLDNNDGELWSRQKSAIFFDFWSFSIDDKGALEGLSFQNKNLRKKNSKAS